MTGDVGWVDEDGWLTMVDRKKLMIVRGGANISPAEVESVLLGHPAVAAAVVFGLPDERLGERVAALVVSAPGSGRAEAGRPAGMPAEPDSAAGPGRLLCRAARALQDPGDLGPGRLTPGQRHGQGRPDWPAAVLRLRRPPVNRSAVPGLALAARPAPTAACVPVIAH